ncbi:MAG: O-antigen ligase family protein, partial [Chlorobi bacterium]|nr:O-antigen ligase family protein [Chlorobiota bacterium]
HHRGYFSMYIVFALALLFYFDEKQKMFNNKTKKILYFFLIAFFSLMIFLLSSRAGLLSVFILFSVQIIRKIYISKNIFYKISAPVLIFFMLVLVFTNKRIKKTVDKLLTSEEIKKQDKKIKTPARIYLWKASAELIKENFPGGTGYEKFQNRFNEKYSEISGRDMADVKKINLNAHNQFLEIFVKYGLAGILISAVLFLYPIFVSFKKKNLLFLAFLLITGFNFLFESVLNTLAGIVFFAFFYNYFIFVFNNKNKEV